jgi:hypothetical protein
MDTCCNFILIKKCIVDFFYKNTYSFDDEEYNDYEMKKKDLIETPKNYYIIMENTIKNEKEKEETNREEQDDWEIII